MRPNITHVALHVADLAACQAFYRDLCGLVVVHQRMGEDEGDTVLWMGTDTPEPPFVLVLISGGALRIQEPSDYSHLGIALESAAAVDSVAQRAGPDLVWGPRQDPPPVGYHCGVRDPNGTVVEFSYGQPLGPGAVPLQR